MLASQTMKLANPIRENFNDWDMMESNVQQQLYHYQEAEVPVTTDYDSSYSYTEPVVEYSPINSPFNVGMNQYISPMQHYAEEKRSYGYGKQVSSHIPLSQVALTQLAQLQNSQLQHQQLQMQQLPQQVSTIQIPSNIDINKYPDMTTLLNSNSNILLPQVENQFVDHKSCTICGKRITRDMSRHMRTHQTESRFSCKFPKTQCRHKLGKFNRPYDYKKHLLNRHFKFDDPYIKRLHNLSDKLYH